MKGNDEKVWNNLTDLDHKDVEIYFTQLKAEKMDELIAQSEQIQVFSAQKTKEKERNFSVVDDLFKRTTSWSKVVNILIRIKRLAKKIKMGHRIRTQKAINIQSQPHTWKEILEAELIIIRRMQEVVFMEEIKFLKKNQSNQSLKFPFQYKLKDLTVFWDETDQVIRLKTVSADLKP
jgi:hypothetical protein